VLGGYEGGIRQLYLPPAGSPQAGLSIMLYMEKVNAFALKFSPNPLTLFLFFAIS
jgi:hypothetical protein